MLSFPSGSDKKLEVLAGGFVLLAVIAKGTASAGEIFEAVVGISHGFNSGATALRIKSSNAVTA